MSDAVALSNVVDDHPGIGRALETLGEAQRDVERSRAALDAARDELAAAIQASAAPYRAGTAPLPLELLRTLYWELPVVRVRDLARAVNMSTTVLTETIGPRREPGSCYRCGREVVLARRSRSHRPQGACDRCRILDAIERGVRLRPGWPRDAPWDGYVEGPYGDGELDGWSDGPAPLPEVHIAEDAVTVRGIDLEGRP